MSDDYVYQLSVSVPHSGSDYAKSDMVNIRGRSAQEFHEALTNFNQHMAQMCAEVGKSLRAQALVASELGATYVSQEQNPQDAAQQPQGAPVDPWTGQAPATPQNAPQAPQQYAPPAQQQAPIDPNEPPTTPPPHVGAAPECSHGVKKFISKRYNNGKPGYWMAWGCPAPKGDPTQHGLDFIRTQ